MSIIEKFEKYLMRNHTGFRIEAKFLNYASFETNNFKVTLLNITETNVCRFSFYDSEISCQFSYYYKSKEYVRVFGWAEGESPITKFNKVLDEFISLDNNAFDFILEKA